MSWNENTSLTIVMLLVLVMIVLMILRALQRRNASAASALNFDDLLLGDDGRLSKAAAVMMGSFAVTSWLMIHLDLAGKMTEGYLAIYAGAWIAPTVAKLITDRPPAPAVVPVAPLAPTVEINTGTRT
jgi:cbb3-type cytochrome oxidase subunit 3